MLMIKKKRFTSVTRNSHHPATNEAEADVALSLPSPSVLSV